MTLNHIIPLATCLLASLPATDVEAAAPQQIVLEREVIRDRYASSGNQDALHLLKPKGWTLEGGIVWYPNHVHQANVEVRLRNPEGLEQIEMFPFKAHVWMTNWIVPFPRGSNYLGSEVQPPTIDPREYVQTCVLPRHRAGLNARVVGYQEMPEVAKAASANYPQAMLRAGRTRIEYRLGNQAVEEDIYVVLGSLKTDLGFGPMWNWAPDQVFGLRAAKGKLDEQSKLMLAVVNSARMNLNWFAEYRYVCALFLARMNQGIANAGKLDAHIARNSEEIRRMYSESYATRQASQDRISARFSDYIRGVEPYHNPNERYPVQLPSGYDHVWGNSLGQYILSNSPSFNPNVGSTGTWQQLKRVGN